MRLCDKCKIDLDELNAKGYQGHLCLTIKSVPHKRERELNSMSFKLASVILHQQADTATLPISFTEDEKEYIRKRLHVIAEIIDWEA